MAACQTQKRNCKCCCVNSQCCPNKCINRVIQLTAQDRVNGCNKTFPLAFDPNEPFDCGDALSHGCWVIKNAQLGAGCQFTFRVACVLNGGVCDFMFEAIQTAGVGIGTSQCFAEFTVVCNPLVITFHTGIAFPMSLACGCADQHPEGVFVATE